MVVSIVNFIDVSRDSHKLVSKRTETKVQLSFPSTVVKCRKTVMTIGEAGLPLLGHKKKEAAATSVTVHR
jgi:hypothetical protein